MRTLVKEYVDGDTVSKCWKVSYFENKKTSDLRVTVAEKWQDFFGQGKEGGRKNLFFFLCTQRVEEEEALPSSKVRSGHPCLHESLSQFRLRHWLCCHV